MGTTPDHSKRNWDRWYFSLYQGSQLAVQVHAELFYPAFTLELAGRCHLDSTLCHRGLEQKPLFIDPRRN